MFSSLHDGDMRVSSREMPLRCLMLLMLLSDDFVCFDDTFALLRWEIRQPPPLTILPAMATRHARFRLKDAIYGEGYLLPLAIFAVYAPLMPRAKECAP